MAVISGYQSIINEQIKQLNIVKTPPGLYEPIEYILSLGGKRIRPALCLAACHFFSGNFQSALNAAIGLEIFHNFTLLHDDIMDHSSMRRNKPTVHIKWNSNTAILSGDAMMIKASQLMLEVPSKVLKEVQDIFLQTSLEVCEGQQLDMEFEGRKEVHVEEYLNMIRLKTAVLLGASLQIGALIGGASNEEAKLIYRFGESIGIAFQLQDDYLDVFGDPKVFGKKVGQDIVSNKKTFLLISCLKNAKGDQLKTLEKWITNKTFDSDKKIEAIKKTYIDLGIDRLSRDKMNFYYQKSLTALDQLNIKPEFISELKEFAMNLMNRAK